MWQKIRDKMTLDTKIKHFKSKNTWYQIIKVELEEHLEQNNRNIII